MQAVNNYAIGKLILFLLANPGHFQPSTRSLFSTGSILEIYCKVVIIIFCDEVLTEVGQMGITFVSSQGRFSHDPLKLDTHLSSLHAGPGVI